MKRYGNLYKQIVDFENLFVAFRKALKGKTRSANVAEFARAQEVNLLQLQRDLMDKTYAPGGYRTFMIYEKKPRMISAAPFRDRVVHHALCNIVEPIFERSFIFESYANRKGKGTHRAVKRCQRFAQTNRLALKCDIKKYFPSMDHEILKSVIRSKIKDADVLWLCDIIIDNSNPQQKVMDYFPGDSLFTPFERRKGLPIGNQTSQFFANVYLNGFDHFVKENLRCKYYLRYVDDFVVLANTKQELWVVRDAISRYLEQRRLKLHPDKVHVFPVTCGIPFLGYRIFPERIRIDASNVVRFRRRMKTLQRQYAHKQISFETIRLSIAGWLGHAVHADSYRLRQDLFRDLVFLNGMD